MESRWKLPDLATGFSPALTAMAVVGREAERVDPVAGRPFREGLSGTLWKAARAMTAASLVLPLSPLRFRETSYLCPGSTLEVHLLE